MLKYAFLILLIKLSKVSAQEPQYVEFFTQTNCGGAANNRMTSTGSVRLTLTMASVRIFGLWKVIGDNCIGQECSLQSQPLHGDNEAICVSRQFPNETNVALTRFGNAAQTNLLLHIFDNPYLGGGSSQFSGDESNIERNASSFYFVGNNSWQVYELPGFQGESTCLRPGANIVSRGFGVTYFANENKTFGSVCWGCGCTGTIRTTKPPWICRRCTNPGPTSSNTPATSTSPSATSTNLPVSSSNPSVTTTNAPATSTDETSSEKPNNAVGLNQTFVCLFLTFFVSAYF